MKISVIIYCSTDEGEAVCPACGAEVTAPGVTDHLYGHFGWHCGCNSFKLFHTYTVARLIMGSEGEPSGEVESGTCRDDEIMQLLSDASECSDLTEIRERMEKLKSMVESGVHVEGITLAGIDQILSSRTVGRALYYIRRLIRGTGQERTGRINDINLNRWKEYEDILTDSFWKLDKRDRSGSHNAGYWGNFIPQIPYQLMQRFTKKGEWVLDTFLGSGTTLIECRRQGRNGIGFDLSRDAVSLAESNIAGEGNPDGVRTEILNRDSTSADYAEELEKLGVKSVQLVVMHPPYWDIIQFSENDDDLSNAKDMGDFLGKIRIIAEKSHEVLDRGRYLALVIGDKYSHGEWIPLGFRAMSEVQGAGFRLKSIIVKNFEQTRGKQSSKELWRYRALTGGFYVFKHEYIFLFDRI